MNITNEQKKYSFEQVLETMLWSTLDSSNEECENLDENYSINDIDIQSVNDLWVIYHEFIHNTRDLIECSNLNYDQVAHDFWLTCNGHGAGFWDRGLGIVGDKLTDCCKSVGNIEVFVIGDKVHIES